MAHSPVSKERKEYARTQLKTLIKRGSCVFGICTHRTDNLRVYDLYVFVPHDYGGTIGEQIDDVRITTYVSDVLDRKYNDKHQGIQYKGCGYDPMDYIREELNRALFAGESVIRTKRLS